MAFYLVTGGAGFIGSHLVETLLSRGHRVRIVDSLITGHQRNIDAVAEIVRSTHPDVAVPDVVIGDLADAEIARRAVDRVDYVLHQAAIPSVARSVDDPLTSNRANVDATLQLLLAARDAGVKRVVYAGSSSAYGNTETLPKREDIPASPLSPYALQKFVGEQYMQLFTQLYGLETVTLRYFNVFGPRQDPSASGHVINVATGARISLNQLLKIVEDLSGKRLEARYGPPRSGDVRDSQADLTKARQLLGYRVVVPLEEGLRRTLAWFTASSYAR